MLVEKLSLVVIKALSCLTSWSAYEVSSPELRGRKDLWSLKHSIVCIKLSPFTGQWLVAGLWMDILVYIRGAYDKFPDFFFVWALLLIVHTWNSSPLWSHLLRLQCTCTIRTTSGRPHGSPLVWTCQWPSSQPLSSPQLSHNDSLWD